MIVGLGLARGVTMILIRIQKRKLFGVVPLQQVKLP